MTSILLFLTLCGGSILRLCVKAVSPSSLTPSGMHRSDFSLAGAAGADWGSNWVEWGNSSFRYSRRSFRQPFDGPTRAPNAPKHTLQAFPIHSATALAHWPHTEARHLGWSFILVIYGFAIRSSASHSSMAPPLAPGCGIRKDATC